jgi:hypothetical protein
MLSLDQCSIAPQSVPLVDSNSNHALSMDKAWL